MSTYATPRENRISKRLFNELESRRSDKEAIALAINKVSNEEDCPVAEVQRIADTLFAGWRAKEEGTLKDHETPPAALQTSEPTQKHEQKKKQEEEQEQEESPLASKVREIVEKSTDEIALEQAVKKLHAELPKEEKVSLGVPKARANALMKEKKERAAREREAERRQQERARIDNQDVSEARVIEQINAGHAVVQHGNRVLILT